METNREIAIAAGVISSMVLQYLEIDESSDDAEDVAARMFALLVSKSVTVCVYNYLESGMTFENHLFARGVDVPLAEIVEDLGLTDDFFETYRETAAE